MAEEKSSRKLSRRGFLFGGIKKITDRENARVAAKPIAGKGADVNLLAEANVAYEKGRYEEAIEKYREFIKIEPENAEARKRYGHSLYKDGRYIQARVEFSRVLKILAKDNFSSLYLGLCFCRMGRGEDAVESWKNFFNPAQIDLQREVNLQIALIESDPDVTISECADHVEKTVETAFSGK